MTMIAIVIATAVCGVRRSFVFGAAAIVETGTSIEEVALANAWAKLPADSVVVKSAQELGVAAGADLAALGAEQVTALLASLKVVPRRKLERAVAAARVAESARIAAIPLEQSLAVWGSEAGLPEPILAYLHSELGVEVPADLLELQPSDISADAPLGLLGRAKIARVLHSLHEANKPAAAHAEPAVLSVPPPPPSPTTGQPGNSVLDNMARARRERIKEEKPCLSCPEWGACEKDSVKDLLCRKVAAYTSHNDIGIDLSNMNITDADLAELAPLLPKVKLLSLNLDFNFLSDIAPLAQLHDLETLSLIGNRITRVEGVSIPEGVIYVDVSNNMITDLSAMALNAKLEGLAIAGNPITGVAGYSKAALPSSLKSLSLPIHTKEEKLAIKAALGNNIELEFEEPEYEPSVWEVQESAGDRDEL